MADGSTISVCVCVYLQDMRGTLHPGSLTISHCIITPKTYVLPLLPLLY